MINLKEKRLESNMTQQQLADEIHCARTVIANIESGLTLPSIPNAKALGNTLGFDWWEFFEDGRDVNGNSLHSSGSGQVIEN